MIWFLVRPIHLLDTPVKAFEERGVGEVVGLFKQSRVDSNLPGPNLGERYGIVSIIRIITDQCH